jgi:Protein of unknown function (DUF1523)
MFYLKWTIYGLLILLVAAFFHYWLPQHDTVRIVDIDVARMDTGGVDTQGNPLTRDVRFIYAVFPDGDQIEYRNEDTDWGFPFYFKFDSARLANRAANLKSTEANPSWVIVRHYGWRIPWLSMFPNALAIWPVAGPEATVFPWFNVIFLTVLILGFLILRRIVIIWRRRNVDPLVARVDREFDETTASWRRRWRRN